VQFLAVTNIVWFDDVSYPQIKLNAIVLFCRVLEGLSNDLYFKLDRNWSSGEVLRILEKITENRRFRPVSRENGMVTLVFTLTSSYEMKDFVELYHPVWIEKWRRTHLVEKFLEYWTKPLKIVGFHQYIEKMTWLPTFYVDFFSPFDRSRRDLSFCNQSSLDRYHLERGVWYKIIKRCTLYALILSIARNCHPYPLFYVDLFSPFDRSRWDLSLDMWISKDDRAKNT
jgi:hypothetical protein